MMKWFGRREKTEKKPRSSDHASSDQRPDLRGQIFSTSAEDLRLSPTADHPHVWGALMEFGLPNGVATIVAIADGTVSMYTSTGGGVIGAGAHEKVRAAASAYLATAEQMYSLFKLTEVFPLAREGMVTFYLLAFDGRRIAEASDDELRTGRHALSELYENGQRVITAMRETSTLG